MRCENCQSLFFKTLEIRVASDATAVLYKKRCKRCKFKYLLKQEMSSGVMSVVSLMDWQAGRKINLPGSRGGDRARVFVSEYTSRVSQPAEAQLPYLQKIRQAEGVHHECQKDAG